MTRPRYQPHQALFYLSPVSGKLSVVSFVSYAIVGHHKGKPVVYNRITGRNQAVELTQLYTGWEDKPTEFWQNLETFEYPPCNIVLIDDTTAYENLDMGHQGDETWDKDPQETWEQDYWSLRADEETVPNPVEAYS